MILESIFGKAQNISLIVRQDVITGFIASQVLQTERGALYHLGGIIIDPVEQGNGVGFTAIQAELKSSGAALLGFHTESAAMYAIGEKLAACSPELVAEFQTLIGSNNPEGGIDKGRYGEEGLYGDLERFKSRALPSLDIKRGDAVIFIGEVYEH